MSSPQNNVKPGNASNQPTSNEDHETRNAPEVGMSYQHQIAIERLRRYKGELEHFIRQALLSGKPTSPSLEAMKQELKDLEDLNRYQAVLLRNPEFTSIQRLRQQQHETKARAIRMCEEASESTTTAEEPLVAQAAKTVYEDQPSCSPGEIFAQPAAPKDLLRQHGARAFVHANRIRKASRRPDAPRDRSEEQVKKLEKGVSEMKL
ncbi:hypothetical protein PRZ48_011785 [Zasmidium cellare]|uniref:Uncharacterized protein n=1 Tax=Zasmidium cellare TaxID=395010 RepID=A0ABR0E7E4_ZASCE|nr:hypothetical protein PRZ48_011785 [Zasmidium cellare]